MESWDPPKMPLRLMPGMIFGLLILLSWGPESGAASVELRIGNMVVAKKVKSMVDLRFENIVRQTKDYSCGAASLATILTYYFGRETSEEEILVKVLNDKDQEVVNRIKAQGLSLLDLKNFSETLGFSGKGFQIEPEQLKKLDRPAIVLINYENYKHFVVLKSVIEDKVYLADPAKGNMVKSIDEFEKMWNGILLAFTNGNGEKIQSHSLVVNNSMKIDIRNVLPGLIDTQFATDPSEF